VTSIFQWIGLIGLILTFLVIDLNVFNRKPHAIKMTEALLVSLAWISLALLFNVFIWYTRGSEDGVAFLTGYILEKLLSLDNMFVFVMVFKYFAIAPRHQHRILYWGIIGAIVFRLAFIVLGIKLIEIFDWVLYLFGALLIYSSYTMFKERHEPVEIESNKIVSWAKKWLPIWENYKGRRFFLFRHGKWFVTPLFIVLLVIEVSDIIFAIDSIPAIFAITLDPYIVFTSNIFAILGLRSLYFLLANVIPRFYYLQHALSVILGFVGIKLILANHFKIPLGFSLTLIIMIFIMAIVASVIRDKRVKK
jgi:tellurite resistance protein TerC